MRQMVLQVPTIYRDLEEMMRERGLYVDHTPVWRWVQRYAPEIKRPYANSEDGHLRGQRPRPQDDPR